MMDHRFPLLRSISTVLIGTGLVGAGVMTPGSARADDPPAQVGRIALIEGSVSMHSADEDHWDAATLNYPVTGGYAYWTEPAAHAALQIGGATLRMSGSTEVDVGALDYQNFQATVPQGEVAFHLYTLKNGESYQLATPQGTVRINQPGRYRLEAGSNGGPMQLTVFEGSAEFIGPNVDLTVKPNEEATIAGTDSLQASVGPIQAEDFDRWVAGQERPVAPPRYVSPELVGYQDLDDHGSWSQTPDYGAVWYPQVHADWAPYREGHWAFVAPWGWTWVDDAPWGFAPFHYGRWVRIEDRWAWAPGEIVERPVYAPALVTFIGGGGWSPTGIAIGVGVGVGAAFAVGWIPLGPHEVYHPYYPVSPGYVRNVNVSSVRNITNVTEQKNITVNNYINRAGATVVPAAAMTASRPVAAAALHVAPQALASAPVTAARAPVAPTLATHGATPAAVRAAGGTVTPEAAAAFQHEARPGPAIRTAAVAVPRPTAGAVAPVTATQARPTGPDRPVVSVAPSVGRPTIPPPNAQAAQARLPQAQGAQAASIGRPTQAVRPVPAVPAVPVGTNRAAIAQAAGRPTPGTPTASPATASAPAAHPVHAAAASPVSSPRSPTPPTAPTIAHPTVATPRVAAAPRPAPQHPAARPQPVAAHPAPQPAPHPAAKPAAKPEDKHEKEPHPG